MSALENQLCPCKSGLPQNVCCLTLDGFFKRPNTAKVNLQSDYANPGCYARELGYCSRKISGEHFISDGILKGYAHMPIVQGFRWQKEGEEKAIGRASLVSNILCTNHNNSLSHFDSEVTRLHKAIANFILDHKAGRLDENFVIFSGDNIERAAVKTLLGGVCSNSMYNGGMPLEFYGDAKNMCLDFLFNGKKWGDQYAGLYYYPGDEKNPLASNICGLAPLLLDGKVLGAEIYIAGISFLLFLTCPNNFDNRKVDPVWQRPHQIILTAPGAPVKKVLQFSWTMPSSKGWFEIEMSPKLPTNPVMARV